MIRRVCGAAVFLVCWAASVWGSTWVVCPTGCDFSALDEAVGAAMSGDTIVIRGGTYAGDLWIKSPLSLQGEEAGTTVVDGRIYVLATTQVRLHGLTVRGGIRVEDSTGVQISDCAVDGPGGVVIRSSSATVRGVAVTGSASHGVLITLGSRVLIADSTVTGSAGEGIHVAAAAADIRDCEIHDNRGYAVWADASATVVGQVTLSSVSGNARGMLGGRAQALDREAPPPPTAVTVVPSDWTRGAIAIRWSPPEDLTGIAAVWHTIGVPPDGPGAGTRTVGSPVVLVSPPEGRHTVYLWLEDGAGNRSETHRAEVEILADRTPPRGEVLIQGGARHVFSTTVTLTIEAADHAGDQEGSGVESMRLSNDGKTWTPWQAFATTRDWNLKGQGGSDLPGAKTVTVELRDVAGNTGRISTQVILVQTVSAPEPVLSMAMTGSASRIAQGLPGGSIRIVDPSTGREVRVLSGHTGGVHAVAFSPDERVLVSGSSDNTIRTWDLVGTREPAILRGHAGGIWAIAFSPDGETIASASSDGTVRLWDVARQREIRTLSGHTGAVRAVGFSPDGKLVVSGGDDRSVRVWDPGTGRPRQVLAEHTGPVRSVVFSPDGALLASAGLDGKMLLWDVAGAKLARTITGSGPGLRAAAFSPSGAIVVAGSAEGRVIVWETATGDDLDTLVGHTASVNALLYTADGQTLATAGSDGVVRLWEMEP